MEKLLQLIPDLALETSDTKAIVNEIDELHVENIGLTIENLKVLIKIVCDPYSHVTNGIKNHIIKNYLFFKDLIPNEIVYIIVGNLGVRSENSTEKRLAPLLQNSILTWLISVYPFLDDKCVIGNLYGLLFNYLDYEYIRPKIAHLLLLSTKQNHVTDRRIYTLMRLHQKYPQSEHVIGLLLLYQQYAPEKILDTFPKISHKVFAPPNAEYSKTIETLISRSSKKHEARNKLRDEAQYLDNFENKLKRRKMKASSTSLDYSLLFPEISDTTLEDLSKTIVTRDVAKIWNSLLFDSSSISHLLLALKSTQQIDSKMNAFLGTVLDEDSMLTEKEVVEVLRKFKHHSAYTNKVPDQIALDILLNEDIIIRASEPMSQLIFYFMKNLDTTNLSQIVEILELHLKVSHRKGVEWFITLVDTVGSLLQRLLLHDIIESPILINIETLFSLIIESLIGSLQQNDYDRRVLMCSWRFISLLQKVPQKNLSVKLVVLPAPFIYTLLYCNDPVAISELGGHLNFAKTVLRDAEPNDEVLRLTNLHNIYVVDICNSIWRNKAFDIPRNSNSNILGLSYQFFNSLSNAVPIYDRNSNFKSLFNIHHSPAFSLYSAESVRKLENSNDACIVRHEGPLTQGSVFQLARNKENQWLDIEFDDIRVMVLKDLESSGYTGLADVLFSHLKSIMNKR